MSSKLQPVRGTHDILPDEFKKFDTVISTARELGTLYGFAEMATPIFEQTEVFSRSMGETSDVVSKEMFTFETRGGESVTLRPEFTAGTARAFISNGMQQNLPLKLFSTGQVFRYERPQKGRQRQFHQVNFELLGDDNWQADVEMILLASNLLSMLSDEEISLHINTLGDVQSREKYRDALVAYLTPLVDKLSEDSQRRLVSNPLRILDSKDKNDKEILVNAPIMTDYLSDAAKQRFEKICAILKDDMLQFSQKIIIDPALVRGLDYYTDTVFEFVANSGELGAQNTVLAGGRYDGLIEQMGGKTTPAIGFASGVERLSLLLADDATDSEQYKVILLPLDGMPANTVFSVSSVLRFNLSEVLPCLNVEILWHGKLSKRLEKAVKNGASYAIIMSPEDEKEGVCIVKNIATREEKKVFFEDLTDDNEIIKIFTPKY
jgi:histidyl-tRNA synthetase